MTSDLAVGGRREEEGGREYFTQQWKMEDHEVQGCMRQGFKCYWIKEADRQPLLHSNLDQLISKEEVLGITGIPSNVTGLHGGDNQGKHAFQ